MKFSKILFFAFFLAGSVSGQRGNRGHVEILFTPGKAVNSFIPVENIGGAIDGHFKNDIDQMLTPANIRTMLTAGLKPVSYRLRTELAGEVWHWNPSGRWSDSAHHCGYWTSDTASGRPILLSYGYRLPRRGNTHDQANDDGYSRIDDGDTATFWKSNPYLDSVYTGEPNSEHPQWIVIDLKKYRKINAIRIRWADPYALSYRVDFAKNNDPSYFDPYQPGIWFPFDQNIIDNKSRTNEIVQIAKTEQKVRYIRVLFTESSHTANKYAADIRGRLGFAVKEIEIGKLLADGRFVDYVSHAADHRQSTVYVSSTDSWHTAKDIDLNVEQDGIDRFFSSGLVCSRQNMFPVGLLYDSPDNQLALLRYMLKNHYPVTELEMGEEPEGQLFAPADYAVLYMHLAKKMHSIAPTMQFGGPSFASISVDAGDSRTFTESDWTREFVQYLQNHSASGLFNFFSFEWYPFDNLCDAPAPQLLKQPAMLMQAMDNIKKVIPAGTPMHMTEYGYSAYEGKTEAEIAGGLMYADILGSFLNSGGSQSYLYGYEPAFLQQTGNCGFGNNMLFGLNGGSKIRYKTAAYYIIKGITKYWAQPSDKDVEIFPANTSAALEKKDAIVSAYCLRSGNGQWRVMLINKDPYRPREISLNIRNTASGAGEKFSPQRLYQYSTKQYHWLADGMNSHPSRALPPEIKSLKKGDRIILPPFSFTILF